MCYLFEVLLVFVEVVMFGFFFVVVCKLGKW